MKKKIINVKDRVLKLIKDNKENFVLPFWFILSCLLNAFVLRLMTVGNILILKPFLADLAILILISAPLFLMKPKKRIRYILVFSIVLTAICVINAIYYTYYTSFASVSLLATTSQVVDVGDAVLQDVLELHHLLYLWQPIFIYYIHNRLLKRGYYENKKVNKNKTLAKWVSLNGVLLLAVVSLFVTSVEWGRFGKLWNREYVVMKFGIYTYQINDIVQSIRPKINTIFGYDNAAKIVDDYYKNKNKESVANEYTNIFEGKNIIAIHAESIQTLMMELTFNNKEITPNLNKIASEGIYFSNFYAQEGVGRSSDSEFSLNTSLMPSNSGTVFVSYFDREYVTIPKLLKEKGYYSFSMHGNVGDFWNRLTMHKNMGYDMFYHKSYYEIDETIGFSGTGLSDKSFFRQAVPIIKKVKEEQNRPFYATLIMLSNHTPWDDMVLMDEFPVDYKVMIDGEIVSRPYLEGTMMGRYIRHVHYADQAIGQLIDDLDKEGLLENTVVIIYGDHDAKLDLEDYNILYNYDALTDTLLEETDIGYKKIDELQTVIDKRVPFIIWTKEKNFNKEVDSVMGMIDVMPTLGNMFNFKSDYQLGNDVFSISDNMVVFSGGNFITDKYYRNSQKEITYSIKGDPIDEDYITKKTEEAQNIIEVSNNIITYDLIKNFRLKSEQKKD